MILMLDADERVTPELRRAIEQVLTQPPSDKVYSLGRSNLFLGRFMRQRLVSRPRAAPLSAPSAL